MFDLSIERCSGLQDEFPDRGHMKTSSSSSHCPIGKTTGIQVLDDRLPEGLPEPCALLVLADPASGKLLFETGFSCNRIEKGDKVLWISMENFTDDLRKSMFSESSSSSELMKRITFIDCYSSQICMKSPERFCADPGNLPNLSIVTSLAMSEVGKDADLLVVLDSLSSLIQKVGVRASTEFFRTLVAKTRYLGADSLTILNRLAFSSIEIAAFEEIADGVIELKVTEEILDMRHYLRIRKMQQKRYISAWAPYEIDQDNQLLMRCAQDSPQCPSPVSEQLDNSDERSWPAQCIASYAEQAESYNTNDRRLFARGFKS